MDGYYPRNVVAVVVVARPEVCDSLYNFPPRKLPTTKAIVNVEQGGDGEVVEFSFWNLMAHANFL
jgi:hypothetical protein